MNGQSLFDGFKSPVVVAVISAVLGLFGGSQLSTTIPTGKLETLEVRLTRNEVVIDTIATRLYSIEEKLNVLLGRLEKEKP